MIPYKSRARDQDAPVEVYRNLNRERGKVWYTIRQHGKVIGHARELQLAECTFVVHEAGRQRVLATGHKNVHAFIRAEHIIGNMLSWHAPLKASYNPRKAARFTTEDGTELTKARYVRLSDKGLQVGGICVTGCCNSLH